MSRVPQPLPSNSLPSQPRRRRYGRVLLLLFLLSILGFLLADVWQPRIWLDSYARIQYQPDSQISRLAERLSLSRRGEDIFLASSPVVSDAESFNEQCARREATVSILGCYDDQNIYIYHVSEPRLSGVMETTAAHELLHAAYARLNWLERPKIDDLIMKSYDDFRTPELEERLEYYRRIDPGAITNELHSILGTELAQLSPELEAYYGRYFTDRTKLVGFYQNYHQQFVDLKNKAEELKRRFEALQPRIDSDQANYVARLNNLNREIESFNQRANSGYYTSQWQFNGDRQSLMTQISALEKERQRINNLLNEYNQLIEDYNNNATQYQKLNQSIDSLSQAPTL